MNSNNNDWDRRKVDFTKVHGDDTDAFACLARAINPKQGMVVADIMGGYGGASREILDYCDEDNLRINLILSDSSTQQIEKSKAYLAQYEHVHNITRRTEDARRLTLASKSLDAAVIKMGLHEVQLAEQPLIIGWVYNSLKSEGNLFLWHCAANSSESNAALREIIRKKDQLAGFNKLSENRHFTDFKNIELMLQGAGFEHEEIYRSNYGFRYNTANLLDCDFGGDVKKLQQWNDFIRTLNAETKNALRIKDFGDSIEICAGKRIYRAYKPSD